MVDPAKHTAMANAIRALAMDAVEAAKSGHPGLPMGAADFTTVLFTQFLKFDPTDPYWPDRDRLPAVPAPGRASRHARSRWPDRGAVHGLAR
jgi:transketolase